MYLYRRQQGYIFPNLLEQVILIDISNDAPYYVHVPQIRRLPRRSRDIRWEAGLLLSNPYA